MTTGLLFIVFFISLLLTVPIAFSIGLSSSIMVFQMGTPPEVIIQRLFTSIDSFSLLAIPFFILAGALMEKGGISKRLIDLAYSFVGNKTGGLAIVTIIASMFFSAISGSGPATVAAIGSIMIPAMVSKGYDVRFAAATQAAAGELGVIIPPSIPLILYGISAGVSIGDLFMAGVTPGLIIGFSLIFAAYFVSKRKNYKNIDEEFTWGDRLQAFKRSILALIMPIIILGGIYGGFFTPTEASVVATAYALVVAIFIYKTIKWNDLVDIFYESSIMSAIILIIISCAGLFSWVLTYNGIPQLIAEWFIGISESPIVFLLLINLFLFILGMFFDVGASIIILAPILAPIAAGFGIDPVHFGLIMIVNLSMGMITPPLGVNLFVVCQIANTKLESIIKPLLIYVFVVIIDLLIISYVPDVAMWLPEIFRP